MHIAIKSFIGISALGGIATGGYFIFKKDSDEVLITPKNKQNLKDFLNGKNDFEALSTKEGENADEWKKLITEYLKTATPPTQNKISLVGIQAGSNNDATNIKKIQVACQNLLLKTEDFEDYVLVVKNWCNKNSPLIKAK